MHHLDKHIGKLSTLQHIINLINRDANFLFKGNLYWFEWVILFFYSLAPEWNFRYVIFKQILVIGGWGISGEVARIWMSLDVTDDQLTLVQVMAWCHQATNITWASEPMLTQISVTIWCHLTRMS